MKKDIMFVEFVHIQNYDLSRKLTNLLKFINYGDRNERVQAITKNEINQNLRNKTFICHFRVLLTFF